MTRCDEYALAYLLVERREQRAIPRSSPAAKASKRRLESSCCVRWSRRNRDFHRSYPSELVNFLFCRPDGRLYCAWRAWRIAQLPEVL